MQEAGRVREVASVRVLRPYVLRVVFSDGRQTSVDVSGELARGGVFEPLLDPDFFAQAAVDSVTGGVVWPNEVDMRPDWLYELGAGHDPIPENSGQR